MSRRRTPEIVKSYCEGYRVVFEGTYNNKQVYSVTLPQEEGVKTTAYTGFPCYVLWDPDEPKAIEQVSDTDLAITHCISEQKRQKRLQSKLKRQQEQILQAEKTSLES